MPPSFSQQPLGTSVSAQLGAMTSASELDRSNPLADFHAEFCRPEDRIYLDGNSLGLLPHKAAELLEQRLGEWRKHAVEGWIGCGWFDLAERLAVALSTLLGAAPDEVVFTGWRLV
jgi:kynureninase